MREKIEVAYGDGMRGCFTNSTRVDNPVDISGGLRRLNN